MSSEFSSQSPQESPAEEIELARASPEAVREVQADEDGGLLAEVLRQTEWNDEADSTANPDILAALKKVAAAHPGAAFELEPVGTELVAAALDEHFGHLKSSPTWERMCHRLARSLFEDPTSLQRLQQLWQHLSAAK
ncbi:MAG: hypothetical protein O3A00_25570 [Planctomycetota bacterium]|nr:hypothetical protein [Planctomycetota bacterium]